MDFHIINFKFIKIQLGKERLNMKILILLVILLFLISGCVKYADCGSDITCFQSHAKTCTKSKLLTSHDENSILTTLRGVNDDKCRVSFKIIDVSEDIKNSYPNEASELNGKTLNCFIPFEYKNNNKVLDLTEVSQKLDEYCTGQIKEIVKGPLKEILKNQLTKYE